MTTPIIPIAGFSPASPRTWSAGDRVTTPRLRAAMYNLAALYAQGRPIVFSFNNSTGGAAPVIPPLNSPLVNTWNVTFAGTFTWYQVPVSGWYLMDGWVGQYAVSGGGVTTSYRWGMYFTLGTAQTVSSLEYSQMVGTINSNSTGMGNSISDLVPLNSATDSVTVYSATNNGTGATVDYKWGCEWVGLPSSATISGGTVSVPLGTVTASPKPASLWPAGGGVALGGSVAAAGTVLSLPPTPGLRAGQVIGLDWQSGQQAQTFAELATVQSVSGTAVTVNSALLYGHSAGAPVSVPVSAAFLNEQVRDQSNFWFYPPLLRAQAGTTITTIANNSWTTVNLFVSGLGIAAGQGIDNFSGFSTGTYTVQVSGVYLVAGSVYFLNTNVSTTFGASVVVGGTRYYGEQWNAPGGTGGFGASASVRRQLRLTSGQQITLAGFQNSGNPLNTNTFSAPPSRLVVVMRSF